MADKASQDRAIYVLYQNDHEFYWRMEQYLLDQELGTDDVERCMNEGGCYWHNDPSCVCDEPDETSDAEGGL